MIIFWLRTGHCWLRHHLYHKQRTRSTDLCVCGKEPETVQHILHRCQLHNPLRQRAWPDLSSQQEKQDEMLHLWERLVNNEDEDLLENKAGVLWSMMLFFMMLLFLFYDDHFLDFFGGGWTCAVSPWFSMLEVVSCSSWKQNMIRHYHISHQK